ncbi:NAD(P)/FAD-dependent oxidoreductase [Nocardia noduli]|uniref:NAD(P)/FAD-dependent oxidoreductase n=1 Tax=Nocardia noduli TaxID=2815722 RepID=UPI001C21B87A|nr:NAD(P)/FAD-dependent oxidoreductase [Nocardia noduli]
MLTSTSEVLIVGAGAAGVGVAGALRAEGFVGAITLVGDEAGEPYDRPPLSKQILTGAWEPARATLLPGKRFGSLDLRYLAGTAAASLDIEERTLELADGRSVGYDAAVVATGVRPRRLTPEILRNVHILRTMDDALALRAALIPNGLRVVVVGAGFLGLEVAASARSMGADVVVLEPVPNTPLSARMGAYAAEKLAALHAKHGVRVITGVTVTSISGSPSGVASQTVPTVEESDDGTEIRTVTLSDGSELLADVVVVAIGSSPNVEWLHDSGLTLDDGLICDQMCSAGHGVWGVGDVVRWLHPGIGRLVRLEHRTNATEQGQAVARNMLGQNDEFAPIPFFWTEHFGAKIQVAGFLSTDACFDTVHGTIDSDSFVQRVYDPMGSFVGVLGWNAPRQMITHRAELMKASSFAR